MQLIKYIEKENKSLKQAAQELGFAYENLRRYCAGSVIPRPDKMQKIYNWSGGAVTPNDFYKEE